MPATTFQIQKLDYLLPIIRSDRYTTQFAHENQKQYINLQKSSHQELRPKLFRLTAILNRIILDGQKAYKKIQASTVKQIKL